MVKIALIGCAHIHTPGFVKRLQARPDVSVAYVWDHERARAAGYCDALHAPYAELDDILADATVDGVVVCSETVRHEPLVLAAAAAKKHMFVEKPLAIGPDDAYRMAGAIERAGVAFQTGYFMRGNPSNLFLREQIAQGAFGAISRLRVSNCHAGSLRGYFDSDYRWMADPAQSGCGGFGDLGTHVLDIAIWLMGGVKEVTARTAVVTGRYGDCDESGEGLLVFENGVLGSLAAGWVDIAHPVSLILSGTEGHAYVANGQLFMQSNRVAGADGKAPWSSLPEGWPHAFELFLDKLTGKDVPLVTAREAAYRSAVVAAFYEAAATSAWVRPRSG